jgi:hypothetical protein
MKYLMLAYTSLAAWDDADYSSPEFDAVCTFYQDLGAELTESGEMVTVFGLEHPVHSRSLRRRGDDVVATDGPFAEAKEVLVSGSILDCASYDRATEIAARVVAATGDAIEIRPMGSRPDPDADPKARTAVEAER